MAIFKVGALISGIRGSIGGTTFSLGPFGVVVKNKSNPPVNRSFSSVIQKSKFKDLSAYWGAVLSQVQRDAWNAATINFPQTNPFGATFYLSGYDLFQKFNGNILLIDETIIDLPPTPAYVIPPTQLLISANTYYWTIFREIIPNPVDASIRYVLYATSPYRSGISNANNLLRFGQHTIDFGGQNINIYLEYSTKFGSLITGAKGTAYVYSIQKATGLTSGRIQETIVINNYPQYIYRWSTSLGAFLVGDIVTGAVSLATAEIEFVFGSQYFVVKNKTLSFVIGESISAAPSGATGNIIAIPLLFTLSNIINKFFVSTPFNIYGFGLDTTNGHFFLIFSSDGATKMQIIAPLSHSPGDNIIQSSTGASATIATVTAL